MTKEQPFKVALVGTSCIGKTSVFERLKAQLSANQSIAFVEEAATLFYKANPSIPQEIRTTKPN